MNTALLAAASGDWTRAEEALGEMVAKDPGNFTVGRATGVERREVNRFPRTFGRRSTTSLSRCCVREESKRYGDATGHECIGRADGRLNGTGHRSFRSSVEDIAFLRGRRRAVPVQLVYASPFFPLTPLDAHGMMLVSYPIRASFDCRHRQEARAPSRSRKVERRWSQNVLLKDAFELDVSCSAYALASLHSLSCVDHAFTTLYQSLNDQLNVLTVGRACKVSFHS